MYFPLRAARRKLIYITYLLPCSEEVPGNVYNIIMQVFCYNNYYYVGYV